MTSSLYNWTVPVKWDSSDFIGAYYYVKSFRDAVDDWNSSRATGVSSFTTITIEEHQVTYTISVAFTLQNERLIADLLKVETDKEGDVPSYFFSETIRTHRDSGPEFKGLTKSGGEGVTKFTSPGGNFLFFDANQLG